MDQNWELSAAAAWQGYQQEGRGAVVVFSQKAKVRWTRMPWGTIWKFSLTPATWISDQAMQETGLGWPGPEETRMVQQYNPQTEVVFVMLRDDGGVSSYRLQMPYRPAPPQAYEQMKDELVRRRVEK